MSTKSTKRQKRAKKIAAQKKENERSTLISFISFFIIASCRERKVSDPAVQFMPGTAKKFPLLRGGEGEK